MAVETAPEVCPQDLAALSADEGLCDKFWEQLNDTMPSSDDQACSASRGLTMGVHCVWSNDSGTDIEALRLDFPDSFPPDSAEDDMHDTTPEVPIPCMAQLLEMEIRACEDAPATRCRGPRTPCSIGLPMALSCSDLSSMGCLSVPGMIPSAPNPLPKPGVQPAAVPDDAKAVESRPQPAPPQLRTRVAQPGVALCHPAVRGAERRPLVATTVWRGCQKNPWCNRETRHRGICNARAAAPGFAPAPEEGISFETPPKEELGSVAEEPCQDTNDSEQASATEVKCEGSGEAPQSARREGPARAFPGGVPMPLTPTVAPPCLPSQDSLDSCRSADSNMPREEENRDAGDICSMRVPAAVAQALPASAFAAAAAPATPKAAARGLKRGIKAIAAPCSSPVLVPPIQEVAGEHQPEAQVPQVAPGCVQLSSGRIARPTPKTAPSRAPSAELSENFPCDEGKACGGKRRGARLSKASAEKAAKRRRLVGGLLKTVGAAAPGQQCTQCGTQVTPVWRAGPYGPKTLCNACGVRYMKQVKKK